MTTLRCCSAYRNPKIIFNASPTYRLIWICALLMLTLALHAQDTHFILSNTHIIKLTSELTGRDHELIIFLPDNYQNSPEEEYPTLYFMDAYWDMPLLNSIHGQLVYDKVIPELIMVGFSYPGENVNYGDLRARDLTPTREKGYNPASGEAPLFLQFIEETVIPFIETEYRADPNERALSGSSLGGLFTLYSMYEKPLLFKRFIAISPAAEWDNRVIFKYDDDFASENESLPVRLFLSQGSDEYPPFRQGIVAFQKKIADRHYQNLALLNYTIEGERHSGVKSDGYSRGLRWVFKDIAPTSPSGLAESYSHDP